MNIISQKIMWIGSKYHCREKDEKLETTDKDFPFINFVKKKFFLPHNIDVHYLFYKKQTLVNLNDLTNPKPLFLCWRLFLIKLVFCEEALVAWFLLFCVFRVVILLFTSSSGYFSISNNTGSGILCFRLHTEIQSSIPPLLGENLFFLVHDTFFQPWFKITFDYDSNHDSNPWKNNLHNYIER